MSLDPTAGSAASPAAFPASASNWTSSPYIVRHSRWRLGLTAALSIFLLALASIMAWTTLGIGPFGLSKVPVAGVAIVLLIYASLQLFRLKAPALLLYADRVEKPGLFGVQTLPRSEIAGVGRTIYSRSGSYFMIRAKPGPYRDIRVPADFRSDPQVARWIAGAPDPAQVAKAVDEAAVRADERYGLTEAARMRRLATARGVVLGLSLLFGAVAIWIFAEGDVSRLAIFAAAISAVMGTSVVLASQGLVVWITKGARPSLVAAVAPAGALAFVAAFQTHLETSAPLLVIAAVVALAVAGLTFQRWENSARRGQSALGLGLLTLFLVYGLGAAVDVGLDGSAARSYRISVLDKHMSTGRSTSYHLRLAAWGARGGGDVTIPSRVYNAIQPGDIVCVAERKGALSLAWYSVAPCAG